MTFADTMRAQVLMALQVEDVPQAELARRLGMSAKHVCRTLGGVDGLSPDLFERMLRALGREPVLRTKRLTRPADIVEREAALTWQQIAVEHPAFIQWAVQRHGGLPDGPVQAEDYNRLKAEYEATARS